MRTTLVLSTLVLGLFMMASPMAAQVSTAGIFGTVTDKTGAVVAEATVTVTNTDTNFARTAKSEANGDYSFKALPIGPYKVEVSQQGFRPYKQSGVVLDVSRNAKVDVMLEVGAVTDTVSVTGDAPLVNVSDAQIGRTVQNREIAQLPLVNRDIYSLLNLTPGVEMNTTANTVGFRQTTVSINGSGDGGTGSVAYYLDGGANMTGLRNTGNATPNPDTVREFRVITNGYGAEFGRFTSGVVDVVTKSGTNSLHGSLFEFLRNDKLNANDWNVVNRPPQRRNQFGGSVGGPIRKDKLFIFGSYSGLRQRFSDVLTGAVVATDAERKGDFSASSKAAKATGITNGVIQPGYFDTAAMKIISDYIPGINQPSNKYQGTVPRPSDSNDVNFKIDYMASTKNTISGSYFYTKGFEFQKAGGNIPWSQQDYNWKQQNMNVSDTWSISPNLFNQFRMTYVRNFGGRLNVPDVSLGDLGSKFTIQGPKSLPQVTVSGFFTLSQAIQGPIAGSNYYGLRDSVNWIKGRHSLKFGIDGSLEKFIQDTSLNNYGVWTFDGKKTGNALADFEMGLPASFKQDAPITKIDDDWYAGLFVQDDFRVHSRLTLNMGLRYELPTSMTDPLDRKMAFAPGVQSTIAPNAPIGLLFPGDPGVNRGIIHPSHKMFAPRFGLAWDPFGDGKTSIRAAAGIFYGSISSNNMNMTSDYQPYSARQTFANVKTFSDPYGNMPGGVSPFPISFTAGHPVFALLPSDVSTIAQNFHFPYTYQLNLSVQRQLRKDLSLSVAYVGALSHHLPFTVDRNYPVWSPTATTTNLPSRRPYLPGTLGLIYYEDGIINSDYHGLQTTVNKRLSHGISLHAYYVYSKSLEGAQSQNNQPTGGAEDFRNLALERGRTNNDKRQTFSFSGVWTANYVTGSNRWVRNILNGWSLSAIALFRSGTPLTITTGTDSNVDGSTTDRADIFGNPVLDPNRPRPQVLAAWFNTSVFKAPAAGADGNSSRNMFDGPGDKKLDLGMFRQFTLHEAYKLEFRAEMTNSLNFVNLNNPNTNLNSTTVGTISGAGAMRATQLGLHLIW